MARNPEVRRIMGAAHRSVGSRGADREAMDILDSMTAAQLENPRSAHFYYRRMGKITRALDKMTHAPALVVNRLQIHPTTTKLPKTPPAVKYLRRMAKHADPATAAYASAALQQFGWNRYIRVLTRARALQQLERATFELLRNPASKAGISLFRRGIINRAYARASEYLYYKLAKKGERVPIYFPGVIRRTHPEPGRFMPIRPLRRFKPPSSKVSTGELMFTPLEEPDIRTALSKHQADMAKLFETEKAIKQVLEHPKVRKISSAREADEATELVFAPEGLIRFYQGKVQISEKYLKILRRTGDWESPFQQVMKDLADRLKSPKHFIGVAPTDQLYAVPREFGKVIKAAAGPTNPWIRFFIDMPNNIWRNLVLLGRPAWYVYNVSGGAIFSTLSHTGPTALFKALRKRYRTAIPEDLVGSTMGGNEFRWTMLGSAEDTELGRAIARLSETRPGQTIQWTATNLQNVAEFLSRGNSAVDEWFRRAGFIGEVERRYKVLMKRAGRSATKATDLASQMDALGPEAVKE
jgi:hypothetical protein